jgi:hypothetical protein
MIVELHWEVAPDLFASSLQAEQLWNRLEPLKLLDFSVRSLSATDLLLSLCVHGSKHLWMRLAWICDVAELLRARTELDWRELWDRARSIGAERMVTLGLFLAHYLLDAPMSRELKTQVDADKDTAALAEEVYARLCSGTELQQPTPGQNFRFNMRLRENWRSRARYCRLLLRPTDGDVAAIHLPRQLIFVYYILRPFRLLKSDRERRLAG